MNAKFSNPMTGSLSVNSGASKYRTAASTTVASSSNVTVGGKVSHHHPEPHRHPLRVVSRACFHDI